MKSCQEKVMWGLRRMNRPLALAFVGRRTAGLVGAGLLRLGGAGNAKRCCTRSRLFEEGYRSVGAADGREGKLAARHA